MRRLLVHITPYLQLARVTTAFAAVGNTWFVILWTRSNEQELSTMAILQQERWLLVLGGGANAVGLYAFGVCLNDILDARRDRSLRPDRPVASGELSQAAAASAVAATLILAVLGATVFGKAGTLLTLALAVAILVFNAAGKFVPAIGLVLLGLILAGQMMVPNVHLRFLWPVWLVMTHAMIVAGVRHWLARKVPPISRRAIVTAFAGWLVWSAVLLALGYSRRGVPPWWWPAWVPVMAGVIPALLAGLYAVASVRRVRALGAGPRAAEKIGRYGALWITLYACGWLFGARLWEAGSILAVLTIAGVLGMTILREWYTALENPLGYRRE